jgi:molybdate transport system ATP-binding protein
VRDLHAEVVVERGGPQPFRLDAALHAPPGITCILGRSGSGKSTLLAALAGLVRPDRGRITLGDEVWFDHAARVDVPTRRRHVAFVFQGLALFPHLDAIGNVSYGMPRSMARSERRDRARALLARLEVGHLATRRPRTFSGGEAQRVALARALAMQPTLILLDEPFSALDRELRLQLIRLVRDLIDEQPVPLVHVTHNTGEARALADVVVRMSAGKVIERGPPGLILPRRVHDEASPDVDETPPPIRVPSS